MAIVYFLEFKDNKISSVKLATVSIVDLPFLKPPWCGLNAIMKCLPISCTTILSKPRAAQQERVRVVNSKAGSRNTTILSGRVPTAKRAVGYLVVFSMLAYSVK